MSRIRVLCLCLFAWLAALPALAQNSTAPAAVPATTAASEKTGPDLVTIGVFINDIQELDLRQNSFTADFYIWMRWKNPEIDPSKTLEFMNAYEVWDREVTPLYDAPQDQPDGTKYMAIRYRGMFASQMPLNKYPFDSQRLVIDFEDNTYGSSTLAYVADKDAVTVNPEVSLSGYRIGTPLMVMADHPYPTNFGDLNLNPQELEPYSRGTISVPIVRPNFTFGLKVILPIFLVAACASLVFWLHPSMADGRIGLGITALLTLVALQLTTNDHLPDVDYLMMIDALFLAAYLYIIACLGQVVRSSWLTHDGKDAQAIAQDRTAFVLLSSAFVLAFIAIMAWSLLR